MNYTYQSFNFRNRQGARPFYDLVASIAAEEFGHIELVSAAINTMLTGAAEGEPGTAGALDRVKGTRNTQQFIAGGAAALVQDSKGKPWNGDYVFSSGDLIEDLTHNFFLETGARNNKLKVYEMVEHPGGPRADRLPAGPRRRPPGRLRPRAREPHRRRPDEALPVAADPDREDPRVPAAHQARRAPASSTASRRSDFKEIAAVFNGPHPETGEELVVAEEVAPRGRAGLRPAAPAGGLRAGPRARGDRRDRRQAAQGRRPAQGARPASSPTAATAPRRRRPRSAELAWHGRGHHLGSLICRRRPACSPASRSRSRAVRTFVGCRVGA